MAKVSPFLNAGHIAEADTLVILYLKRDQLQPVALQPTDPEASALEKPIQTTRFGTFPHDTLVGAPWGSQIRASKVDTGSRGANSKKRKRESPDDNSSAAAPPSKSPAPIAAAGTGFAHLLQPTPETWTSCLTHRTQVVYSSDYSYILQRTRTTPGSRLIEAGAGSGSFTHAAARAVYDGAKGHVYSFEYHDVRARELALDLKRHRLSDVVTVTHRDVYTDGFKLSQTDERATSPRATVVFLDLPAPWMALRHLTRSRLSSRRLEALAKPQSADNSVGMFPSEATAFYGVREGNSESVGEAWVSPLDPTRPVHLCTFTPCIEQVQSTMAALRQLGWVEIEMVEVQDHQIEVRRERVGLAEEGLRGTDAGPKDVDEAMNRLREVEGRFQAWSATSREAPPRTAGTAQGGATSKDANGSMSAPTNKEERKTQKQRRQERNRAEEKRRKLYAEGTLASRIEQDIKSHTSYLTFAVLPVEEAAVAGPDA